MLAEITKQIATTPGVARIFQSEKLAKHKPTQDRIERAASFSYFSGRSGDMVIALKPYWIYSEPTAGGTTHGSANEYDQHVPVLLYGSGGASRSSRKPGVSGGYRSHPGRTLRISNASHGWAFLSEARSKPKSAHRGAAFSLICRFSTALDFRAGCLKFAC